VETVGATYVAQDAVRDGRIVSAPTWVQHPAFYREIFRALAANQLDQAAATSPATLA
jgi:protease I